MSRTERALGGVSPRATQAPQRAEEAAATLGRGLQHLGRDKDVADKTGGDNCMTLGCGAVVASHTPFTTLAAPIRRRSVIGHSASLLGVVPGLADRAQRQRRWPQIAPRHGLIDRWLDGWARSPVAKIRQRLRYEGGLGVAQSSLRRDVWANCEIDRARAAVLVLRGTRRWGKRRRPTTGRWVLAGSGHRAGA
jgi:hypothetical protein